VRRVLICI